MARVRRHLADCAPVERRLAEFVLDFPGDLASYTASELAQLTGVSNATVTRFIHRQGVDQRLGHRLGRSQDKLQRTLARPTPQLVDDVTAACLAARKVGWWACVPASRLPCAAARRCCTR